MQLKYFLDKYEHKEVLLNPIPKELKNPLVSVCVTTYNHIHFIEKCLNAVVNQKVNFNYEVLIGDDDSTDGTREICEDFARRYPDKIRLFLHHRENNISLNGRPTGRFNFFYNLYQAKGKYIAWCDGDDYWTDLCKLQKQVDFLEQHTNYGLHCGAYLKKDIVSNTIKEIRHTKFLKANKDKGFSFTLEEFKKVWIPKSLTVLYRRSLFPLECLYTYSYFRDTHLFHHILKQSKGYYLNEIIGCYHMHGKGVHSGMLGLKNLEFSSKMYAQIYSKERDEFSRFNLFRANINLFFNHLYSRNLNKISFSLLKACVKHFRISKDCKTFAKAAIPAKYK